MTTQHKDKRASQTAESQRKKARIEESEDEIEVEEDEEEEEEEEEGSSSEEESDSGTEEDTNLTLPEKLAVEQRLITEAREMGALLKADRAKVAREGGLLKATEHLNRVNAVFTEKEKHGIDNKTVELYDSRNFVESSDLMDIAVRNIKVGSTDEIIKPEDYFKKMRHFLLRTSMTHDPLANEDREAYLDKKHKFETFNWFAFGTLAHSRGHIAHTTDHLLGPLEIEKKVREVRTREKLVVTSKITTAEAVTQDDVENKATDHTTLAVQNAFKVFKSKAQGRVMNIFEFFINPNSFGESVENMFYTSFLLKDGRIQLGEDENGYPTVTLPPDLPQGDSLERERQRRANMSSNHLIFQLEYDSWRKLIKRFNITTSFIPTRGGHTLQ